MQLLQSRALPLGYPATRTPNQADTYAVASFESVRMLAGRLDCAGGAAKHVGGIPGTPNGTGSGSLKSICALAVSIQSKSGARPVRALSVGAKLNFSGPMRNNGWVALSVLQNGGEKRRLSRAGRPDPEFQLNRYGLGKGQGGAEPAQDLRAGSVGGKQSGPGGDTRFTPPRPACRSHAGPEIFLGNDTNSNHPQ